MVQKRLQPTSPKPMLALSVAQFEFAALDQLTVHGYHEHRCLMWRSWSEFKFRIDCTVEDLILPDDRPDKFESIVTRALID